jgi:hypothetical protein
MRRMKYSAEMIELRTAVFRVTNLEASSGETEHRYLFLCVRLE